MKRILALFLAVIGSAFAANAQGTPSITTSSPLAGAVLGTAYSQTFAASGGTGSYSWSVASGTVPAGLTLSSAGVLSGTPTAAGRFSFTVRVTDSASATTTAPFVMQVFLQMSANGIGMPYPTDTTTYDVVDSVTGRTIHVPSGFVWVPGGTFTYGTGASQTTQTVDGFCEARFELTNAEYKAYMNATGSTSYPSYWTGGNYPAGRGNHPMLYVSLTQATAYVNWIKQQTGWEVVIPSAPQWERAARGPNAYLYPWGNTLDASYNSSTGVLTAKSNFNANVSSYYLFNFPNLPVTYYSPTSTHYNETVTVATIAGYTTADVATPFAVTASASVNGYVDHNTNTGFIFTDLFDSINNTGGFTTPAGSYPNGVSAYGAYDKAGNAFEWTTSTFIASNGAEAGQVVNQVRGGGWYSNGSTGQTVDIGEGRSATGNYNSVGFRIIMMPLTITSNATLPGGLVGTAYSQQLTAVGGQNGYTWGVSAGSLPSGFTLSSAGVLSGTPQSAGTTTFTLSVTSNGDTATKVVSLTFATTPVSITTTSPLANGVINTAYSQTFSATGGTAPYTWAATAGTVPTGTSLTSAGVLSGTPTTLGTFSFTMQATDSGGLTASAPFTVTITTPPLTISTASVNSGYVGTPFSQTLAATGGTGTGYVWALASGSTLPGDLTLSTVGVLSGTPTTAGSFSYTVQVTDSASTVTTKAFTQTIGTYGALHHFTWDSVPATANAGTAFAVQLSARDSNGAIVANYNGSVGVSASVGAALTSPIVITEVTDESEDQFELQNISNAAVNTTGWYVRIGDAGAGSGNNTLANLNTVNANTFTLPATLASGGLLRVTETNANVNNAAGIYAWNATTTNSIAWQNSPSASRGWVALFDNTNTLRDFFIFNWDAANFANFNVTINGTNVTAANCGWNNTPITNGTRVSTGTSDSWQRQGTSDNNSASDWVWRHNTDNSNATTFNATNPSGTNYTGATFPGITIPWASNTPLTMTPTSVTLVNGVFSGQLTISQTAANATLAANDGASHTGTSSTITINSALPLVITTTSPLAGGAVGTAYSTALAATGGINPYTWTVSGGALPGGLSLSSAGVLSGTPNAAGVFSFTAQVTDSANTSTTQAFSITIAATALSITTTSPLPGGTVGTAYSQTLAAAGGTTPYTWSVSGGSLPGGLSLSSAGVVSGTPTAAGTFSFTAQVADSGGLAATRAFSITTVYPPLSITTASPLTGGTLNTAYSTVTFAASGGTGTGYTWSVNSGSLPAGLSLNSAGVLSGTPASVGTFNFSVLVTDSASATTTKSFSLTVAAFGALHHFTWNYVPATANANAPFAARLTARDAAENLITTFNGTTSLTAAAGTGLPTPVVITEVTPASENQIELQNVSNATVNTIGWFMRIGDSTTNSVAGMNTPNATTYNLPASLAAGALLRVSETNTTSGGRSYFGSSIGWLNTPGNRRGWVALFDSTNTLRDFYAFGWTASDLASFSITVNGQAITLGSQWSGAGTTSSGSVSGQTYDSFQRTGTSDNNSTADWAWKHNADNSDPTSLGVTNTGLTVPWSSTTPLTVSPTSVTFANGEFLGYVTIATAASNVALTANDGSSHIGTSALLNVGAALADTDGDGIPDSWESAHGSNPNVADSSLDTDGDGASNLSEYKAGTDPQSAASKFGITSSSMPAANQFSIAWPGAAGKLYRVRTSEDLATWTTLTTVLPAASGTQTITMDTGGAPTLFVRVEIVPAP